MVLPIKNLVNQDSEPTNRHKLATGTKPSVSNPRVLFCILVLKKATAHVDGKTLNLCHQSQKWFPVFFVVISQHQKGYLIYVPSTPKIGSLHDVVFDETFYSALAYTSHPYLKSLATRPELLYITYATSSHEQNGDIINFAQL